MEPHNHELMATAKQFAWVYLRLHRLIAKSLSGGAPSLAQMKLLAFLEDGGKRSTDIAGYFGHSPRTVTQAIDALEAAGHVRRGPVPGDRRAKLIEITPDGLQALHAVQPIYQEVLKQAFAVLPEDDLAALNRILDDLLARIETLERS
jgi:DNA-binding MarR family transcriptional regulator